MALRERGALTGGVAVTVMSNYGFHQAMEAAGIEVATTKVGDRHVIAELLARGWSLGGEQSGHIIWTDFAATGDGIAAALLVMSALDGRALADARPFEKLPQRLENVRLSPGADLDGAERLWDSVASAEKDLEGRGRVLVRPSGTEPLVRLMVEAPSAGECDQVLARLVEAAEADLG
jgi:phosphoglucosamine mutase